MMGFREGAGLVLCILVSLSRLAHGATDPNDVNALNVLYSGFSNPPQLTNWVQNAGDPCGNNWLGVTCTNGFVTSLVLSNQGLQGSVQGWVLQKLSQLQVLDLSSNNIGGAIPGQFPPIATQILLQHNVLTGSVPYLLTSVTTLTVINLSYNKLSGNIPNNIWSPLVNLVTLDLSFNNLQGSLPSTLGDLVNLQTLQVQDNMLSGSLPTTLVQLSNLKTLNIENNQFTGYLPPGLNPPTFRTGGNQINTQAPPPPPFSTPPPPPPRVIPASSTPSPPSGSGSSKSGFFNTPRIAGVAVAGLLVLLAIGLGIWFCLIRKRPEKAADVEANRRSRQAWFLPLLSPRKEKETKHKVFEPAALEKGIEEPKVRASPPIKTLKAPPSFKAEKGPINKGTGKLNKNSIAATAFTVADLQAATNSFSQDNLVGEGALSRVYRADFPNGQVLAVKKLDSNASMVQNEDDFLGVVGGMARLKHANTTELVGYCVEHDQRLLVYEYVSRGTLNELLHSSGDNTKGLSWNVRVKIALGSARALEYLHEVCSPPVVHRNFKSANILLDDELNPHLSDCGLANLAPSGSERQVSAQMLGSFGYSAPEYAMSGTYTVKSDVYSFGVVMLELLTGRKPLDSSRSRPEQSLVRWATPQLHDIDALARMVDPALKGIYPAKSLSRFADIVALCVQPEPEFRPPMSEVVQALVRLMQRASLSKRRSESEVGAARSEQDHSESSI